MGRRRTQRADNTLRQVLLKDHRNKFGPTGRWHIPGRVSEYEQALVAGEAIVVDSSTIMCALNHAGRLPSDEYAFGGRHWANSGCWTLTARCRNGLSQKTIAASRGRRSTPACARPARRCAADCRVRRRRFLVDRRLGTAR